MIPLTKGHRRAAQFQFVTFHRATFCKAKCPEHFAFRVGKRSWGYLFFAVDVTGQDVDVQLVFNNAGFIVTGQEWAGYRWRKVGRLAKT